MYGHERTLVENLSSRPFALLGVNTDSKISRVKKAIKENNLNWRSWYDGRRGPIAKSYKIRSYPTIFLVDHNGVVRYKNLRGARLDMALEKLVALAESDGMKGGSKPGPVYREFVDLTGKFKTVAVYTGYEDGNVLLQKEDEDKIRKVLWRKLSIDDRRYVAKMRLKDSGLRKAAKKTEKIAFDEPFGFTEKSSGRSVEATFVALNSGEAVVWKADGSEVRIPWRKLSDDSKEFINAEIKRMK